MRREAKRWAVLGACLLAAVAAGCSDPAAQLNSDDPAARIEAVRALARKDSDAAADKICEAAAVALGRTAAANPVRLLGTAARQDPSANVRAAAVTALGQARAVSEMDALLAALEDEDRTVRERASAAVTRILGRRYETYVDGKPEQRHEAVEALRQAFYSEMAPHVRAYYSRDREGRKAREGG